MTCSNNFTYAFYWTATERLRETLSLRGRILKSRSFEPDTINAIREGPGGAENVIGGSLDVVTFKFLRRNLKIYLYKIEGWSSGEDILHASRTGVRKLGGKKDFIFTCDWQETYMPVADLAAGCPINRVCPTKFEIV